MSIRCFAVPALHPEPALTELNTFLALARVVALQRELVADGANSYWAFCVEVTTGVEQLPQSLRADGSRGARTGGGARNAIDYKEVLNAADFSVFAALRDMRKQLAQTEGVPMYAVFTNEQLAQIAERRVDSKTALADIDGIGGARVGKYGDAVLACMSKAAAAAAPLSA